MHGLFMEGARWDTQQGAINESKLKELTPQMPVVFVKAVPNGNIFLFTISIKYTNITLLI